MLILFHTFYETSVVTSGVSSFIPPMNGLCGLAQGFVHHCFVPPMNGLCGDVLSIVKVNVRVIIGVRVRCSVHHLMCLLGMFSFVFGRVSVLFRTSFEYFNERVLFHTSYE